MHNYSFSTKLKEPTYQLIPTTDKTLYFIVSLPGQLIGFQTVSSQPYYGKTSFPDTPEICRITTTILNKIGAQSALMVSPDHPEFSMYVSISLEVNFNNN